MNTMYNTFISILMNTRTRIQFVFVLCVFTTTPPATPTTPLLYMPISLSLKLKGVPKPKPRHKRHTSDRALHTSPSSPSNPPPSSSSGVPQSPMTLATPTGRQTSEPSPQHQLEYSSEEMSLSQFASLFQNSLPQQVEVTDGVYWRENVEVNISNSERLNVYFVRHRESVS